MVARGDKVGGRGAMVQKRRQRINAETLSPMQLSVAEAKAAVVGLALAVQDEPELAAPARAALGKIVNASPPAVRDLLARAAAGRARPEPVQDWDGLIDTVEAAIANERELRIAYIDQSGENSTRTIRPIALAESRSGKSVAAWCTLRGDFRHFRLDHIEAIVALDTFFKGQRQSLLARCMQDE